MTVDDIKTIETELILADLETITKLIDNTQKDLKAKTSKSRRFLTSAMREDLNWQRI